MVKTGGKNHEKVVKNDLNYRKTLLVGINRKNKKKLFSLLSLLIETTLKHIFLDSTALAAKTVAQPPGFAGHRPHSTSYHVIFNLE